MPLGADGLALECRCLPPAFLPRRIGGMPIKPIRVSHRKIAMNATPVCSACRSPVEPSATKCAKCGEWRPDIKRDRNRYYIWAMILFLPLLAFLFGLKEGWWAPVPVPSGIPGVISGSQAAAMLGLRLGGFDFGVFLASPTGLAILVFALAATWRSWHFYAAVSRKTGNWVWM